MQVGLGESRDLGFSGLSKIGVARRAGRDQRRSKGIDKCAAARPKWFAVVDAAKSNLGKIGRKVLRNILDGVLNVPRIKPPDDPFKARLVAIGLKADFLDDILLVVDEVRHSLGAGV